jgi:hypothetical protein
MKTKGSYRTMTLDTILREEPGVRLCSRCRLWKTVDKFYADKSRSTGVKAHCKQCVLDEKALDRPRRMPKMHDTHDVNSLDTLLERIVPVDERCEVCALEGHPRTGPFVTADGARLCARHLKRRVKERRSA